MSRTSTSTGEMLEEIIAPKIQIDWNAVTNRGQVYFHMARLVSLDGVPVAQQDLPNMMVCSLEDLLPRTFTVVTGQDADGNPTTTDVPAMLVMATLKTAFAQLFDEKIGSLPGLIDNANASQPSITPPVVLPDVPPAEEPAA